MAEGDDMRTTKSVVIAVLLLLALSGCTKLHEQAESTDTFNASLSLDVKTEGEKTFCKATVSDDPIRLEKGRRRILWTVTDNCSGPGAESETQFAFKYRPGTAKKWLDAEKGVARTEKGKKGEIQYRGHDRGQADGDDAYYTVFFNGEAIVDPKVVWGK
jgi:hypothetical protein